MPESISLKVVKRPSRRTGGLGLFSIVRNEEYFLPFFFDHYRRLGVEQFVIYDDRSDDGTSAFLHDQPDCTVLASDWTFGHEFGAGRRLPLALKESVPELSFANRWGLTVDADEFLVLPTEFRDLTHFIDHLEVKGVAFATAPMVDFYGETLNHRAFPRTVNPFEANPYFDVGPYYVWTGQSLPRSLWAGVRSRLLAALIQCHPDDVMAIYGDNITLAAQWKVPLIKYGAGISRIGDHEITANPEGDAAIALAHFKFYPDLDAKISVALAEGQYFNGSKEYKFLNAAIHRIGAESLVAAPTRRFTGPTSLAEAGLIRVG